MLLKIFQRFNEKPGRINGSAYQRRSVYHALPRATFYIYMKTGSVFGFWSVIRPKHQLFQWDFWQSCSDSLPKCYRNLALLSPISRITLNFILSMKTNNVAERETVSNSRYSVLCSVCYRQGWNRRRFDSSSMWTRTGTDRDLCSPAHSVRVETETDGKSPFPLPSMGMRTGTKTGTRTPLPSPRRRGKSTGILLLKALSFGAQTSACTSPRETFFSFERRCNTDFYDFRWLLSVQKRTGVCKNTGLNISF